MHGWELDLKTLEYQDSHVIKEKIDFEYLEPNLISFETLNPHFFAISTSSA